MLLELGMTAPEMMLFPYMSEPATGSLIPSISTGGLAINATIKQMAAASNVGIINTPNHPTYNLLSVAVVDAGNHLLGAITVDDVLDRALPGDWRRSQIGSRSGS